MRSRRASHTRAVEKAPPLGARLIGYAKVSTRDQNPQAQIDALLEAGVHPDNLHHEHASGVARKRPALNNALLDARSGDTFIVWKLDRMGRSVREVLQRLADLDERGIYFKSLSNGIDTSSPTGRAIGNLLITLLAAIAEFERELTRERTIHGVKRYRERGGKHGAPRQFTDDKVQRAQKMRDKGKKWADIARHFGVTTFTVKRYVK